jgi:hypothetical protein
MAETKPSKAYLAEFIGTAVATLQSVRPNAFFPGVSDVLTRTEGYAASPAVRPHETARNNSPLQKLF